MIQQANPGVPFDFNAIYGLLKDHAGLAILAVILFLLWKYAGNIGIFFKEYLNKKVEAEGKKAEEIHKQNDRYFELYESNTEAVKKVGEAINSFEKAFISSEARTGEKILGVETRLGEKISTVESRLSEKIVEYGHEARLSLEKISSKSGDNRNGDHS